MQQFGKFAQKVHGTSGGEYLCEGGGNAIIRLPYQLLLHWNESSKFEN